MLMTSVIAGTVLVFAMVTITRDTNSYAQYRYNEFSGHANILASVIADDLSSNDRQSILQRLTAVRNLSLVDMVSVQGGSQNIFAQMGDISILEKRNFELQSGDNLPLLMILKSKTMSFVVPVLHGGEQIGVLTIYGKTDVLRVQIITSIKKSIFLALSILAIGIVLSWIFQRSVTGPIIRLTSVMDKIQESGNYSHFLPSIGDQETARLIASFNNMLEQIRTRDQKLSGYSNELEGKILRRTRELMETKEEAERANRAKSDFLAIMSHEIRTPLNGMLVISELLARSELNHKQQRHADILMNSGRGLLAIINDILDLSKIESGKLELEHTNFSPSMILDDVVSLFQTSADEAGLAIRVNIDDNIPNFAIGDPVRIRQVLNNFINNALKFTSEGYVKLSAKVIGNTHSGKILYFAVDDTGIGIEEEKQKAIFDSFSQADQSITRKYGGTGLGLAICERLVTAMGGKLGVKSKVGVGARFWFAIPVKIAQCEVPVAQEQLMIAEDTQATSLEKEAPRRILLADDNVMNHEIMHEALDGFNVSIVSVFDGAEAVKAVQSQPFDLVFMDGSMPELEGPQAVVQIRLWEKNYDKVPLKIIALTAGTVGYTDDSWSKAGIDGLILKPFTLSQISECFETHLNIKPQFNDKDQPRARVA